MPRQPRIELAGGIHHVTGKTPSGRDLFHDDRDRQLYLQLVAREVADRRWGVLTFCLMTNHVHLLIQTPEPDLGDGFKRIHQEFAQSLNARHDLQGHVFGNRFYSGVVASDRHLFGCLRYIARNPVRHGACRQPREWRWSAHCALAGLTDPPAYLDIATAYSFLGASAAEARRNYLRLVTQSDQMLLSDLRETGNDRWLLTAVDDFAIAIADVATFLRISVRTAQRRIAAARDAQGTDPSATDGAKGTDPSASAEG